MRRLDFLLLGLVFGALGVALVADAIGIALTTWGVS